MTILMRQTEEVHPEIRMPGWDIVADLTPPELLDRRALSVLRRRIATGLLAVVVLCAAGFAYALAREGAANDDVATASQQRAQLTHDVDHYAGITQIENTVAAADSQQATLLKDDVDVPRAVGLVRRALPASMSIENLSVTVTASAEAAASSTTSGSSVAGLDASGNPTIGTVTVSGSGRSLNDLPSFVDRLSRVRGFVDVLPTSNQIAKSTSQFSVTLALTDLLLTHRYDAKGGVK